MSTIRVADFSLFPGGRYVSHGPFSGEQFRNEVLAPALISAVKGGESLTVVLDGTKGYGSSFLEEAFGGLIRNNLVSRHDVSKHLVVTAHSRLFQTYKRLTDRYIADARPELAVA